MPEAAVEKEAILGFGIRSSRKRGPFGGHWRLRTLMSARTDLCGGCRVTGIPTATGLEGVS